MNENLFATKNYENKTDLRLEQNKPKQTQFQTRRRFFSASPLGDAFRRGRLTAESPGLLITKEIAPGLRKMLAL